MSLQQQLPRLLQAPAPGRPSTVNCTWRHFPQPLDHFSDGTGGGATFAQRVCLFSAFATAPDGPIFFYTGNESPVDEYVNNTGLMWELGRSMGALLVYAEHRFEPATHPPLSGIADCFSYCTTAQALADFAGVAQALKAERAALHGPVGARSPVVAFGGSYGGMLAGWFRIRYPHVVAGSIAASAPVWGLAHTLRADRLDWSARAISRGVSKEGGASDACASNLRAAWPLIAQLGRSAVGRSSLASAARSCSANVSAAALSGWAQAPWFYLAEGNFPFASTYITYAVGPGAVPLPPWPMREACGRGLGDDHGVRLVSGSLEEVEYGLRVGALRVDVRWNDTSGNGANLTRQQIEASGVLGLVRAVADGAGVWYNARTCEFKGRVPKTLSWDGVTCNEDLYLFNNEVQGAGRDVFWPPTAERNASVDDVVGPHTLTPGCTRADGLYGAPATADAWSPWLDAYYGGLNISAHRNIIWSNGLLDPWSGGGVYPEGGGIDGPMVQNISADGSHIALLLAEGAHHLDLMWSDPADPPSALAARKVEEERIRRWCDEWREQH